MIFTVDWIKGNLIGTASDREPKFFGGRRGFSTGGTALVKQQSRGAAGDILLRDEDTAAKAAASVHKTGLFLLNVQ